MAWTLCTSGSAIAKAGAHANSDITASGSTLASWSDEVESEACSIARVDVVSNYDNFTANGKEILNQFASAKIAQRIINYDMTGYFTLGSAITMLNVLENDVNRTTAMIREDKIKTYLKIT